MNYYNFIKQIKNISLSNGIVNEVGEGDIYQHLNSGMHKYPCVFLTVQTVTFNNDIVNVNATMFYVDRLLTNSANKVEIQSNGLTVLSQILDRIAEDTVINTVQNVYTPFEEKFADLCAGQFVTFRASFPNDVICSDDNFEIKTITLTHNGIYDIMGYDEAVVAVEGGVWGQITGNINEQTDLMNILNNKQDTLQAGTNISIENGVVSNTYVYDDSRLVSDISDINDKIPSEATSSNQLADKNFVNSTVASSAANFRGIWSDWASVPTDADDYPEDYTGSRIPTRNDYLTITDASDYTGETLESAQYRFYYVGEWSVNGKSGWVPQYKIGVNFTAAQQAALNSGINSTKVAEIDGKQNILTEGNGISIINDVISSDIDKLNITGTNTIQPNKFYVLTDINTAITISKGTDVQNKMNLYAVRFNLLSGGSITFNGFGTIKWNGKGITTPTWEVGKTYEVSIEDGFAFYGEF